MMVGHADAKRVQADDDCKPNQRRKEEVPRSSRLKESHAADAHDLHRHQGFPLLHL